MKQPLSGPRYKPPIAAIRIGGSDRPDVESRYGAWLVVYMRVIALLWMGQGVFHWSAVLTPADGGPDLFESVSFLGGTAIIFFCVLDLIAAVGLWLAATWGGVVWLVAVSAQWLAMLTLPGLFAYDLPVALLDVGFVAGYFYLTYRAARESEPFV